MHYDPISDVILLQVNTNENTFVRVTQKQFNFDMLDLLKAAAEQHQAHFAGIHHCTLQCLDPAINPPGHFKDAMSHSDRQESCRVMGLGKGTQQEDMTALAIVKQPKGARILGMLTRWEYKEENERLVKYKVRMPVTVRGDQQVEGESFDSADLYAPVLKAYEARLLLTIAAAEGGSVYKTDTSQAFLYGSMGSDVVYIKPPDWWPEPVPEGHCLQLLKSIYGTRH